MNILQILPNLNTGGVETGTVDLAKKLISAKHKAVVVSAGGKLVDDLISAGVRHYTLAVDRKSPINIIKMSKRLTEIIRIEKIDIVHARSRVPAWIAYIACYKTGCKFITTCHGYYSNHFFSRVMGWGRKVIVASHVIGRHMIDDFNVADEKIKYIPRGVDLDYFTFNPSYLRQRSHFTIAIIGRLTPIKGHIYFLKAISRIIRSIPKVKVFIVGDPSPGKQGYKSQLQLLIRQLGISNYVEFLGRCNNIPDLLANVDVVVLPSTVPEAFGRAIIEAQAVGVAVVASNIGGISEVIDDKETGLLVPAKDVEALAEAMLRLKQDKQLVVNLVQKARQKIERTYSLNQMAEKTIEVYEQVLKRSNILIIKYSALGDIILAGPSIKSLKNKFPSSSITLLVDMQFQDIMKNSPYIDNILAYHLKEMPIFSKDFWRLGSHLRDESFDIVVDLQNNSKSHLLGFLGLISKRYGYKNKKMGFLLSNGINDNKDRIDPVSHQARILHLLGVDILDKTLELFPGVKEKKVVNEFLDREWVAGKQLLFGFNISASNRWQTKRWPVDKYARLSDIICKRYNARILITGTKGDLELANQFKKLSKMKPIIACGKTDLLELAELIGRCRIFVTSDSAPMHIAAAMRVPFVAIFGPTDPKRHLPITDNSIVIYKKVSCSPCYKPICNSNKCLKDISVEEVVKAIEELINKK
jgi:lipopolysaccharide heptosyltransferase II